MSEYNPNYLDFEQPLLDIENKITAIKTSANASQKDLKKIENLKIDLDKNISKIFSSLSDWQISQIARHPLRPYTLDYIDNMFSSFTEIHGDRMFGDDKAIICGFATLDDKAFMLIGHQKGRDSKEKVYRNFGMPKPEGYRKALRAMKLAEKFSNYAWESNFGYGTKAHLEGLKKFGITSHHRKSFKPVHKILSN